MAQENGMLVFDSIESALDFKIGEKAKAREF